MPPWLGKSGKLARYDTQLCTSGEQGRALNQAAQFHTGGTDRHVDLQKVRQAFIHAFAYVVDRVGTLSPTAEVSSGDDFGQQSDNPTQPVWHLITAHDAYPFGVSAR